MTTADHSIDTVASLLVTIHRDGTVYTELFDLDADPHELHDVAADPGYSEVCQELQAAALEALVDTTLP